MGNSRSEFLKDTHYHISNRGYGKLILFKDRKDFEKFYEIIVKYLHQYKNIKLVSFTFLPDHFHFVIKNLETNYDISDFMRKLQLSYSLYFKKKYLEEFQSLHGTGLFSGRFKSYTIDDTGDELNKVFAFVNFNALHHKYVDDIAKYPYTSYHQISKTGPKKFFDYKDLYIKELED